MWILYLAVTLLVISTVCELLIIYAFFKVKKLRTHPGLFILVQTIAQVFIDTHWLTMISPIQKLLTGFPCRLVGAITYYFILIAWNYTLFLSIEIYLKVSNPIIESTKRNRYYHIIGQIVSLGPAIALILSDQTGVSEIGSCSIQARTIYQLFFLVENIVYCPLCLGFAILSYVKSWKDELEIKNTLKYHLYVVIGFTCTFAPPMIIDGVTWEEFHINPTPEFEIVLIGCMILGVISGTVVFIARFSQKKIMIMFWTEVFCQKKTNTNLANLRSSLLPYTELFEYVDENMKVKNVLASLNLAFATFSNEFSQYVYDNKVWILDFMGKSCKVTYYNYKLFHKILKNENIKLKNLQSSFDLSENLKGLLLRYFSSNNETFTFLTYDKKYFIRTMSKDDILTFLSLSINYAKRLANSSSYLLSIYGAFSIEYEKGYSIHFIIFENLGYEFTDPKTEILIGDSSIENELIEILNKKQDKCLIKDNQQINLPKIQYEKFIKVLKQDLLAIFYKENFRFYLKIVYDDEILYLQRKKKHITFNGKNAFVALFFDWAPDSDNFIVQTDGNEIKDKYKKSNDGSFSDDLYLNWILEEVKKIFTTTQSIFSI